jgi:uncharacterized protein with HEPN domain
MKKDRSVYLLHIRDALESIESYTRGGKKAFLAEPLIQDPVIYKLAVIGEAVKRLPPTFRDCYPDIPWKRIVGMRDVIIHEYDQTELPRIWNVVHREVPKLRRAIGRMLKERALPRPRQRKAGPAKARSAA